MLRLKVSLALASALVLAAGLSAGDVGSDAVDDCGLLVCASASASLAVGCGKAQDGYTGEYFAWCTTTMDGTVAGASPVFLPGRVDGSASGHVSYTCLNACADRNVDASKAFAASWRGGPTPGPLGLGPGAQAGGSVLRDTQFIFAPFDGRQACVHAVASFTMDATATAIDVNGNAVPLETTHVQDARYAYGTACVTATG